MTNQWSRVGPAGIRRWFHCEGRVDRIPRRSRIPVAALRLALFFYVLAPAGSAKVALWIDSTSSIYQQAAQGFRQGFGNTDQIDEVLLAADARNFETRIASYRQDPPRLVVVMGSQLARTAKGRLPDIPLLYCLALRPVENELVGRNIGGVALDIEVSQQLASIARAFPRVRRIGVVYDALTSGPLIKQAEQYFQGKVQLVARDVRTPQEASRQIQLLMSSVLSSGDAFWLLLDPVAANSANFRQLIELSLRYKVPVIAPTRPFVEAGALMSVGADYVEAGRQAGRIAQMVLRGTARPEDFVAVPPSDSVITINGEVARKMGIEFPPGLRADVLSP